MKTLLIPDDGPVMAPGVYVPAVIPFTALIDVAAARTSGSSTEVGREDWHGTRDMPSAVALARTGWSEGAAAMRAISAQHPTGRAPAWRRDVAGAFPVIPEYVAGAPDCMRARCYTAGARSTRPDPITIVATVNARSGVPGTDLMTIGTAVLSAVDALEAAGTPVRVMVAKRNGAAGTEYVLRALVKDTHEHADLDRLAYALANPSVPRRLFFGLVEALEAGGDRKAGKLRRNSYGVAPGARPVAPRTVYLPRPGDSDAYGPQGRITFESAAAGIAAAIATALETAQ